VLNHPGWHEHSYRLSQLEEVRAPKGVLKVLQRILPDIVAKDIDTDGGAPSCSKGTLVDVKTLSPGGTYPDERTGDSDAAANANEVRVNKDYHMKGPVATVHFFGGARRLSWAGTPYAPPPGPRSSPEHPKIPKSTIPCSKQVRRRGCLG